MIACLCFLLCTACSLLAAPAACPASPADTTEPPPRTQATTEPADSVRMATPSGALDVWIGRSAATGRIIGKIPDSSFDVFGIRIRRPGAGFRTAGSVLSYTGGLVVARLRIPQEARPPRADSTRPVEAFESTGIGMTPLGLEWSPAARSRVLPFFSAHTGFIYFFDPVPDRQGRRLNFTASVGAGLRVRMEKSTQLSLGYRYHHTSNGFRGQINPGVDANLFYVTLTLFLHRPGDAARPPTAD